MKFIVYLPVTSANTNASADSPADPYSWVASWLAELSHANLVDVLRQSPAENESTRRVLFADDAGEGPYLEAQVDGEMACLLHYRDDEVWRTLARYFNGSEPQQNVA